MWATNQIEFWQMSPTDIHTYMYLYIVYTKRIEWNVRKNEVYAVRHDMGWCLGYEKRTIYTEQHDNEIEALKKKLVNWKGEVEAENFESFSLTNTFFAENSSSVNYTQPIAYNHLRELMSHFDKEFPEHGDPRKFHLWVVNPFLNLNEPNSSTTAEKKPVHKQSYIYIHHMMMNSFIWYYIFQFNRTDIRSYDEEFIRVIRLGHRTPFGWRWKNNMVCSVGLQSTNYFSSPRRIYVKVLSQQWPSSKQNKETD